MDAKQNAKRDFVLASESPRRIAILMQLGLHFEPQAIGAPDTRTRHSESP